MCPGRPTPANARLEGMQSEYLPGSKVRVQCNDGYKADGGPEVTCMDNGQWNTGAINCAGKKAEDMHLNLGFYAFNLNSL